MEIRRLRRVCFSFENEFSRIPETTYQLKKLRKFNSSTPKFITKSCAMQIFTNFVVTRDQTKTIIEIETQRFTWFTNSSPEPHQNLKRLGIHNYIGSQFPTWMTSSSNLLPNMVNVVLKHCSRCQHLTAFGQRPFLKFLHIEGLDAFYGSGNLSSFPSFEDLSIFRLVNLVECFSRLQRLKVKFCPKLTTIPTRVPSLEVLEFIVCNGKAVRSLVECNLTSLTSVSIEKCEELEEEEHIQLPPNISLHTLMLLGCPSLISWPSIHGFNSLSFLVIKGCKRQKSILSGIETLPKLEYLAIGPFSEELDSYPFPAANIEQEASAGNYFPSLCSLHIDGWSKLNCLPDQIQYISSLKDLYILDFPSLEVLPEWLGSLTSLRELRICGCKNLNYMPSLEKMPCLTSLQQLKIRNCSLLAARCKQEGEESNKLFHIPKVDIVEEWHQKCHTRLAILFTFNPV
ncbi:hypothetical protein MKX01_000296 [Papaver californicum]|nr:hypothetical protein MKX01_000296 [Papaver californicum]